MRQPTAVSALSDLSGLPGLSGLAGLPDDVTVTLAPDCPEGLEAGPDGNVPLVGYLVLAPAGTQLTELLALPGRTVPGHQPGHQSQEHGQEQGEDRPGSGARETVTAPPGVSVDLDQRIVTVDGKPLRLTYLEFELLAHLVRHPHRVYTREQLVATIWGYGPVGDQRTVDVHIARVRRKLGQRYRGRIVTIRRVGYKYVPAG